MSGICQAKLHHGHDRRRKRALIHQKRKMRREKVVTEKKTWRGRSDDDDGTGRGQNNWIKKQALESLSFFLSLSLCTQKGVCERRQLFSRYFFLYAFWWWDWNCEQWRPMWFIDQWKRKTRQRTLIESQQWFFFFWCDLCCSLCF